MKRFRKFELEKLLKTYKDSYETRKLIEMLYVVINNCDNRIITTIRIENDNYKSRTAYITLTDKIEFDFRDSKSEFRYENNDVQITEVVNYIHEVMNVEDKSGHFCLSFL